MLITNFASGELSESLFGRIDIPQYYSGVSRLENFDVIPTGGIERRGGTKRLLRLEEGDGRVIPFVINRELSFLLYLSPGTIKVYKIENCAINEEPAVFHSRDDLSLYANLSEITEVQCAQSFDTMILCHENYAPLEVRHKDSAITILRFQINIDVEINAEGHYELDKYYLENGWLLTDGNYPGTVTFFNDRLVFAGLRSDRQRVFVSGSASARDFSTYKKFITEKREAVSLISCKLKPSKNEIIINDLKEFEKFTKSVNEYYVLSKYFPEDTMVSDINGKTLLLNNNKAKLSVTPETLDAFLSWKDNIDINYVSPNYNLGTCFVSYGVGKFKVYDTFPRPLSYSLPLIGEYTLSNVSRYFNKGVLYNYVQGKTPKGTITNGSGGAALVFNDNELINFINDFHDFIQASLTYSFPQEDGSSVTLYGTPEHIYQQVLGNHYDDSFEIDSPVVFYTKDFIIDSYPTPDNGFTFEIASDMNDSIKWLAVNKGLVIGTETAEWVIPPGTRATNVQAALNSRHGSDSLQGTIIGDAVCFFQSGKKALVEYYIPREDNNFRANNMATLSGHLLRESPVKEFDFISSPYAKLFITREDGIAVTLLYERNTGTFAWGRITTEGKIKSAAALPGRDGYDELYLLVKRGEDFFLEALRETSGVYLDSYKEIDGDFSMYDTGAVIHDGYVGYPYASRVRSMPILGNDKMKPSNIKNILIRFHDSYMPKLKALPNNITDTITRDEPYTGVLKVMFPGAWDRDAQFEFIHDKPTRCEILAINAEVS